MTEELQTAESGITLDIDPVEVDNAETATTESGAELATATGEHQDKTDDGVQKAINKQHAKYREEERLKIAAQNEARVLKEKLDAIEAEKKVVIVPPVPDPYDEDYEAQVKARDEAIKRQATQDAQQQNVIEQQTAAQEAANRADQDHVQSLVDDYTKRIVTLGLDRVEMESAGRTVVEAGISGEIAEFILQQEDGPLITKYLAANPIELDDLRHLPPIQAALKINSDIRLAASAMKPQASTAPDPAETLTGRGAGEQKNPLIAGATFE